MASIIKIKRSGVTGQPTSLKLGELAVSYLAGTQSNGGDRVYVGTNGVDGSGNANNISVIGGKYFTDMLDHVSGTVTASSALIVDASKKLNELLVDNITIDGNTISTTNVNGDLVLDPNGTGKIDVSGAIVSNAGTPSNNTDLATKGYVDAVSGAALLTLNGDTGTDTVNLADSNVTFTGGTGITTAVTNNDVDISITASGAVAGTYGSSTAIPVISVTSTGQIDSITSRAISTSFTIEGETGTDLFNTGETLTFTGTDPVNTTVSNNTVTIDIATATTGATGIASFSPDNFAVSVNGEVTVKDAGISNLKLVNSSIGLNGNTVNLGDSINLTTDNVLEGTKQYFTDARARGAVSVTDAGGDGSLTYNNGTGEFTYTGPSAAEARAHFSAGTGVSLTNGEIAIGQAVGTSDSVTFSGLKVTGNTVVDGNLQVNGTQTTISSQSLAIEDNMIYLNQLESAGSPTLYIDVGFAANYNDIGSYAHTGFFRDATDGVWKLYDGYTPEPDSDLDIDVGHPSFSFADMRVGDLTVGNINATSINAQLTGSYAGFDSDLAQQVSDALSEGSINLYFTTERVDSALTTLLVAGEGIDIADGAGTYTFSVENASDTNKGIATFDATNFTVISGDVTTNDLTFVTGSGSAAVNNGETLQIKGTAAAGITTTADSASRITLNAVASTLTQRGTASFGGYADSAGEGTRQFSVASGDVSIAAVDGGWF